MTKRSVRGPADMMSPRDGWNERGVSLASAIITTVASLLLIRYGGEHHSRTKRDN